MSLSTQEEKLLRAVAKPNVPKWSLMVIGVCAFGGTFLDVYPQLEPFSNNDIEITETIAIFSDCEFKVIPHRVEG